MIICDMCGERQQYKKIKSNLEIEKSNWILSFDHFDDDSPFTLKLAICQLILIVDMKEYRTYRQWYIPCS